MRLGMFMMPLHPAHRAPAQTLQEDREAIILADRLGFYQDDRELNDVMPRVNAAIGERSKERVATG